MRSLAVVMTEIMNQSPMKLFKCMRYNLKPINVICILYHFTNQGYEERRYPSVNFACTELTYEMPEDKDEGEWTLEKVMEWMSASKSRKNKPQSKMFLKLFRYIAGVNSEAQEIEMTVPVISKLAPGADNKMTKEMCFYITKEFQENPPQPIDKDVVIKKSSERVVFVKKFGGYAMRDSVWMDNAAAFKEEIADRSVVFLNVDFYQK